MLRSQSVLASFAPEFLSWDISLTDTANAFTMFEEHEGPIRRAPKPPVQHLGMQRHDTAESILDDQLAYLIDRAPERIDDCRKVTRKLLRKHASGIIHTADLLPHKLDVDVHTRRVLLRLTTVIPLLAYTRDHFQAEYMALLDEAYAARDGDQKSLHELAARHATTWVAGITEREIARHMRQDKPQTTPARRNKRVHVTF